MMDKPQLIVMLTQHDQTVKYAREIFEECKDSKATVWGLKEKGLPKEDMKALFSYMKDCGKTTVLEVVAYTEEACIDGAKTAVDCGCDILMGTVFFDSVNRFCREHQLKYMPFVGAIHGRPSVLSGSIEDILAQAQTYLDQGVFGLDLLGYRYTGDPLALIGSLTSRIRAPICIAGSINSYDRLDEIKRLSPWAFTIGGGFFEHRFGDSLREQIDRVWDYIADYAVEK